MFHSHICNDSHLVYQDKNIQLCQAKGLFAVFKKVCVKPQPTLEDVFNRNIRCAGKTTK